MLHRSHTKTFSETMQVCSTLCALLVVFIHAYNVPIYTDVSNTAVYWIQDVIVRGLGKGAVPFFFMSSAFFLYGRPNNTKRVYQSRFKSLVIPYVLWNTIFMVYYTIAKAVHLSSFGLDLNNLRASDILGGIFLHDYNAPYWYMLYLIAMIAMYPLLKWIISRNKLVCFSFLVILFAAQTYASHNPYFHINYSSSIIYYYLGALLGFYYKDEVEKIPQIKKSHLTVLLVALLCAATLLYLATNVWGLPLDVFRDISMVLLIVFFAIALNLNNPKILVGLSFMIYSMHTIILESIEEIIYIFMPHNALWMMIDFVVAPLITVPIIVVVCILMKKFLPKVYTVLNGNRL